MRVSPIQIGQSLASVVVLSAPFAAHAAIDPAQNVKVEKADVIIGVEARHEGNVAHADAVRAAARGLVRQDDRLSPSISLSLVHLFARNSLSLDSSVGYDFYRRNTRLNRERINIGGNLGVGAGPCEVNLRPSVSRRQSELGDIAAITLPGREPVVNVDTVVSYHGDVACGQAFGLRPTAMVEREIGNNSEFVRQLVDYRTTRFGSGFGYVRAGGLGAIEVQFNRSITDYPNRPLAGGSDGFVTNSYGVQVERNGGSLLHGSAGVSYTHLIPRRSGVKTFGGLTWDGSLTLIPGPRLQIIATVSRKVLPSLGSDALYKLDRSLSGEIDYAFSKALTLTLSGTTHQRHYIGAGSAFGPVLTDDTRNTGTATVTYKRSEHLTFALDGGYESRSSNGSFYDYHDAFVAIRTQYTL